MTTINTARYDPAARFEVKTFDVEYRREGGDGLLARIYQPQGAGPFPALLDAHGGAWSRGDRTNDRQVNQALAESGLLVAAIDYRLAPQHPYPAQMQDINYGIRWLKANASKYNGNPKSLGAIGASSGGHGVVLNGLRPWDPRYAALPLDGAPQVDAALAYVVAMWPIVDPYARYEFAKTSNQERLVQASEAYFLSVEAMLEGNPQRILEHQEAVELPPLLVIQGSEDANIPWQIPERFVGQYRQAGGDAQFELFPGMPHAFASSPGPESDRAVEIIKRFVQRCLTGAPC